MEGEKFAFLGLLSAFGAKNIWNKFVDYNQNINKLDYCF